MDFSLIGILASNEIGIFAISTDNTDYVPGKKKDFRKSLGVLKNSGYRIMARNTNTDKDGEG